MRLDKGWVEDRVRWLLESGSAPVRYLTEKHLRSGQPDPKVEQSLAAEVAASELVQTIFGRQEGDGSWCTGGPWAMGPSYLPKSGCSPVSPKYVTTTWILWLLGDMGINMADARVKRACEYVLSYQAPSGFISESRSPRRAVSPDADLAAPCRFSLMLIGLGKVGAGTDPRVRRAYDLLVDWQRDDGGWASARHFAEQHWTRSCPYSSYHAALALYSSGVTAYDQALLRALRFLVWHLGTKGPAEIQRFFYHGHSTVHELVMLSERGLGLEQDPVRAIMAWLMSMYRPADGCFHYAGKPVSRYSLREDYMDARVAKYRLFHLIEDDWLTYYATRIVANLHKQAGEPLGLGLI